MRGIRTPPVKIEFARLTPDGKLLFQHPTEGWVVVSPTGHHHSHLEDVDDDILRYCVPVHISRPLFYIPPRRRGRKEVRWEYLLSARVWEDYTAYDPDRCNNGGAYGYWENELLFVRLVRARNGRAALRFAAVRVCRTTADFPYTDAGEFQDQWRTWRATDVEGEFAFTEAGYGEFDAPLEGFPSFRWLTTQEVLGTFSAREVSRELRKRGLFLSRIICDEKRFGRRGRRFRG